VQFYYLDGSPQPDTLRRMRIQFSRPKQWLLRIWLYCVRMLNRVLRLIRREPIMNEKEAIERATAEGFLALYNEVFNETYRIVDHADAPDMRCENSCNEMLCLEITLTEDRQNDITALLGRSDHRSLNALRKSRDPNSPDTTFPLGSSLSDNVSVMLASRVSAKLSKDYGTRVALVVRDTSGVDWSWETVLDQVRADLDLSRNPFDMGIWLVNRRMNKLYRIA